MKNPLEQWTIKKDIYTQEESRMAISSAYGFKF